MSGREWTQDEIDAAMDAYGGEWVECWQCAGEGFLHDCFDGMCEDAESGCDDCERRCDICKGKGGWEPDAETKPALPALGGGTVR